MDKFTRNYSILFATIAVIVLVLTLYENPGVSRLNALLSKNTEVASYPYHFRVVNFENGLAIMSTPRSADFSAYRALAILYPELRNQSPDSSAMLDAQQEMARIQGIAQKIVAGSNDANRVIWELDENWLRGKGVDPSQF